MKKTKLSLYYVASYLTVSGLALTLAPTFALKLFLSNGEYGEVMSVSALFEGPRS